MWWKNDPIQIANQRFDLISGEYQHLLCNIQQFQKLFLDFSNYEISANPEVPGKSFAELVESHKTVLNNFLNSFDQFAEANLSNSVCGLEQLMQARKKHKEDLDDSINKLKGCINNILSNKTNESISKSYDSLNSYTKQLNSAAKNKPCVVKTIWPNYYQSLLDFKSKQAKLIRLEKELKSKLKNYFESLRKYEDGFRSQVISTVLGELKSNLNTLADNLNQVATTVKTTEASFEDDFKELIEENDIHFTDFSPPIFGNLTLEKNLAVELKETTVDDVNLRPYLFQILPDHMAKLKYDFIAQNEDKNSQEMSAKKNQKVGVMRGQDFSADWILCMNLSSQTLGFIPSNYIEKVGIGMAVNSKEIEVDNFDAEIGTLLCLIEKQENNQVLCEDYCGNRALISSGDLILFE